MNSKTPSVVSSLYIVVVVYLSACSVNRMVIAECQAQFYACESACAPQCQDANEDFGNAAMQSNGLSMAPKYQALQTTCYQCARRCERRARTCEESHRKAQRKDLYSM